MAGALLVVFPLLPTLTDVVITTIFPELDVAQANTNETLPSYTRNLARLVFARLLEDDLGEFLLRIGELLAGGYPFGFQQTLLDQFRLTGLHSEALQRQSGARMLLILDPLLYVLAVVIEIGSRRFLRLPVPEAGAVIREARCSGRFVHRSSSRSSGRTLRPG
jgi:hypothetical protein